MRRTITKTKLQFIILAEIRQKEANFAYTVPIDSIVNLINEDINDGYFGSKLKIVDRYTYAYSEKREHHHFTSNSVFSAKNIVLLTDAYRVVVCINHILKVCLYLCVANDFSSYYYLITCCRNETFGFKKYIWNLLTTSGKYSPCNC